MISRTTAGLHAYPPGRLLYGPAPEEARDAALPAAFTAGGEDFDFFVLDAAGTSLLTTSPAVFAGSSITRSLEPLGLPWRLQVQPRRPEALYADFRRCQNFYVFVVVMTLALLLSGGYLTLRTVRREMEVARLKSDFVSFCFSWRTRQAHRRTGAPRRLRTSRAVSVWPW